MDDRIIGIGQLKTYQKNEQQVIPSEQALKRHDEKIRRAQVCRRCGASELDGAMFTTLAGSGICDDCVG